MLENATRICDARFGTLNRFRRQDYSTMSPRSSTPACNCSNTDSGSEPIIRRAGDSYGSCRKDEESDSYRRLCLRLKPFRSRPAKLGGARDLVVPMLKDDEFIGAIAIYRLEVRPFTDKQIELLTNFAAQAVIAIENTRLLNELRQSWSSRPRLRTCSRSSVSTGELEAVLSMLENATRICEAEVRQSAAPEDEVFAGRDAQAPPAYAGVRSATAANAIPALIGAGRRDEASWCTLPIKAEELVNKLREPALTPSSNLRVRTTLVVPMLKGDQIRRARIYRQDVQPFTERQIELVQNFAAQAVIAIENMRLLNECGSVRATYQIAGATDGNLRGIARHQLLARRFAAGVPDDAGERDAHLRGQVRHAVPFRRQGIPVSRRDVGTPPAICRIRQGGRGADSPDLAQPVARYATKRLTPHA